MSDPLSYDPADPVYEAERFDWTKHPDGADVAKRVIDRLVAAIWQLRHDCRVLDEAREELDYLRNVSADNDKLRPVARIAQRLIQSYDDMDGWHTEMDELSDALDILDGKTALPPGRARYDPALGYRPGSDDRCECCESMVREVDALLGALEQFGVHRHRCATRRRIPADCDCGLVAALNSDNRQRADEMYAVYVDGGDGYPNMTVKLLADRRPERFHMIGMLAATLAWLKRAPQGEGLLISGHRNSAGVGSDSSRNISAQDAHNDRRTEPEGVDVVMHGAGEWRKLPKKPAEPAGHPPDVSILLKGLQDGATSLDHISKRPGLSDADRRFCVNQRNSSLSALASYRAEPAVKGGRP